MKRYRVYFFDLYGTLVDIHTDESKASFWNAVAAFYTQHGAPYTGKTLRRDYLELCGEQESYLQQAAGPDAQIELNLRLVFASLYQQKRAICTDALVDETALFFRQSSTTHLRLYAGAKELLNALREQGARVVLLSNAQSCFTKPELKALGLLDCFDQIRISSDAGFKKPDVHFFWSALNDMDAEPAECIMIGNDPAADVEGAKRAGMDALYIHSALSPRPAPDPKTLPVVASLPRMDLKTLKRLLLSEE